MAKHLEGLQEQIAALAPGTAKVFDLPAGLGEIIRFNEAGNAIVVIPATKILVVRGSQKAQAFIKTAYAVE